MAKPVTARLSRASSPASIEDDLAILWRDASHDGPVARALMANLVVYRHHAASADVDFDTPMEDVLIEEVVRRHPARVIVLSHRDQPTLCGPVGATISILLFGPPGMRIGVEQIAVRSACAEASLPSIVRRLSLGDVPISIWWAEDLSRLTPLDALVTMGRQLVYDSRQWSDVRRGLRALAPVIADPHAPFLADLNWRRLTPMRQALAHALSPPAESLDSPTAGVYIRHRPGDSALAWLLVGWFFSRLRWRTDAEWPVTMEEERSGNEVLSASFGANLTATMNGHRVLVKYNSRATPFSVAVPQETEADAIAAELRSLIPDACLREALVALGERFERQ